MEFSLVRFTDGIYHVACRREIKKGIRNQASVYWKNTKTWYPAHILEESQDKKILTSLKKKHEKELEFTLVRFTDGIYHVACRKEIKMRMGKQASVYWKKTKTCYQADILKESQDKEVLMILKKQYEKDDLEDATNSYENGNERITPLERLPLAENSENASDSFKNRKERITPFESSTHAEHEEAPNCDKEGITAHGSDDQKSQELYATKQMNIMSDWSRGSLESSHKVEENIPGRESMNHSSELCAYLNEVAEKDSSLTSKAIEELFPSEQLERPENSSQTDNLIWDELQCNIPFYDILEFESANMKSEDLATEEKIENRKINIISVDTIYPETNNKKSYNPKKQFCLFCEKLVNRFGRHLTSVHKLEKEVEIIISHEKKTHKRKILIDKLRAKGNYIYNHKSTNGLDNIVARRPVNKHCPKEYLDCPNCLVRISKVSMRRHVRKCNLNNSGRRSTIVDSRRVTFDLHKIANPILKEHVFPVFKNDLCTQILRKDYLAILYGNKLVAKYTSSHHHKMIRANLRYIGKYLIEMRKISGDITDFKSCFSPLHYDNSVRSIRIVAGYDEQKGEYRAPYSASAISTILKFCCAILESDYIKKQNYEKIPEVQNFLKLLRTELGTDVYKTVTENLTTIRRSKKVVLPTASDMSKLINYVRSKRDVLFNRINIEFTFDSWKKLASYLVVGIMVYNGRRPGEIQRLRISDFTASSQSSNDNLNLPTYESVGKNIYMRCVLRGKLGRNVSIVLANEEVSCIKDVLDHRELAGVNRENPYVFGLPSKKPFKFLNAGILLKKYAEEAGVQHPERLYATNIRKNLATKTTKLSLDLSEREHVMNFMGHSETIHKTIYQQPDMEKDIAIMPKVLDFATGKENISSKEILRTSTKNVSQTLASNSRSEQKTLELPKHDFAGQEGCGSSTSFENGDERCEEDERCDEDEFKGLEESESDESDVQPTKKRKRRLIDMSLGYVPRKSWTTEEREAVRKIFGSYIENKTLPSLDSCKAAVKNCDALRSRTPNQLKAWINNHMQKDNRDRRGTGLTRRSWSTPEKRKCRELFGEDVETGRYPCRTRINEAIKNCSTLKHRTPEMIMAHLQHAMKKLNK